MSIEIRIRVKEHKSETVMIGVGTTSEVAIAMSELDKLKLQVLQKLIKKTNMVCEVGSPEDINKEMDKFFKRKRKKKP